MVYDSEKNTYNNAIDATTAIAISNLISIVWIRKTQCRPLYVSRHKHRYSVFKQVLTS